MLLQRIPRIGGVAQPKFANGVGCQTPRLKIGHTVFALSGVKNVIKKSRRLTVEFQHAHF
ncbi:hypothetical protein SDC9_172776 [bioreactor metagenome]|uniref:Uncharacterized protein n=1 Tax=bioreactor metagenome TaxID=1076179 RepID=A0A645GEM0_9ZZZZ